MKKIETCDKCGSTRYINDIFDTGFQRQNGEGNIHLCTVCGGGLLPLLSDKYFVGSMIRSTMTTGEVVKIKRERARAYARSSFTMLPAPPERKMIGLSA